MEDPVLAETLFYVKTLWPIFRQFLVTPAFMLNLCGLVDNATGLRRVNPSLSTELTMLE